VLTSDAIAYTVEKMAKVVALELERNPYKPRELEAEARSLRKELGATTLGPHFDTVVYKGLASPRQSVAKPAIKIVRRLGLHGFRLSGPP
jgi:2-hydroxychromene-2-carboxylate isomerase